MLVGFYSHFTSNTLNLLAFVTEGASMLPSKALASSGGAPARCNLAFPFSVTTPRTPGSDSEKATAAPGSPSRTPEEHGPHLPPWEQADSPLVQEPAEARAGGSPRRNSLVIVESADEQPPAFESLDEDSAFQKVSSRRQSRHVAGSPAAPRG